MSAIERLWGAGFLRPVGAASAADSAAALLIAIPSWQRRGRQLPSFSVTQSVPIPRVSFQGFNPSRPYVDSFHRRRLSWNNTRHMKRYLLVSFALVLSVCAAPQAAPDEGPPQRAGK